MQGRSPFAHIQIQQRLVDWCLGRTAWQRGGGLALIIGCESFVCCLLPICESRLLAIE